MFSVTCNLLKTRHIILDLLQIFCELWYKAISNYFLLLLLLQAMQSMRRLMDWTLKDNMVEYLFFCATLTGHRGGHTSFVQAWAKTPDSSAEAVKSDQGSSWEGHYGWVGAGVGNEYAESCGVVRPLSIPLMIRPMRRTYVVVVRWVVVRRVQMGVSIWGAVQQHSMDRWALSRVGAGVQAPWHGVLETVWLCCDEAQQVGCLRGLEGCPLV